MADEGEERGVQSKRDSLREQAVTIERDELHLQATRYLAAAYCPPGTNSALLTTTSFRPGIIRLEILGVIQERVFSIP